MKLSQTVGKGLLIACTSTVIMLTLATAASAETTSVINIHNQILTFSDTDSQKQEFKALNSLSIQSSGQQASDQIPLGTAYQSDGSYFLGVQTVNGREDNTLGNSKLDFRVGVDLGYSQVINLIDGEVDAGIKFPAVRVDAGANYAKDISADNYTGTYTVYAAHKAKSQMLLQNDDRGYTPSKAALDLAEAFPGNRSEHLGDHFVNGFSLGSHMVINMKIDYRNESDKREIGGHLSVDWIGKVKVDGKIQKLDDEKKKSVKITISGFQSGGRPNQLLDIIPNGIMLCTLENPKPCFDIFSAAVRYLKSDYIKQLDSPDTYNVAQPYLVPYVEAGPELQALVPVDGYQEVSFLNELIVKQSTNRWIDERLTYRRAKNIQRYYASSFSNEDIKKLSIIESRSRRNANIFADIVDYCEANSEGNFCSEYERDMLDNFVQDYSDIASVLN